MSGGYPPGCTQRHVDYAAGGYDEYRPTSYEEEEEPGDYDAELDWLSLLETYR